MSWISRFLAAAGCFCLLSCATTMEPPASGPYAGTPAGPWRLKSGSLHWQERNGQLRVWWGSGEPEQGVKQTEIYLRNGDVSGYEYRPDLRTGGVLSAPVSGGYRDGFVGFSSSWGNGVELKYDGTFQSQTRITGTVTAWVRGVSASRSFTLTLDENARVPQTNPGMASGGGDWEAEYRRQQAGGLYDAYGNAKDIASPDLRRKVDGSTDIVGNISRGERFAVDSIISTTADSDIHPRTPDFNRAQKIRRARAVE